MKKMLTIVGLLSISWSVTASAGDQIVTKCRLYNPPNDSVEIPSVGEQKFELNGISVEAKETNRCVDDCYWDKKLSATKNGVIFSTRFESNKREQFFPSLSITENGKEETIQCMLVRVQSSQQP